MMRHNALLADCLSSPKGAVHKQSLTHRLPKSLCLLLGLLLLLPVLAFGKEKKLFEGGRAYISSTGTDDYGAYVEFVAEVSDLDGYDSWTTTGQLFATIDGSKTQILNFTSSDRDNFYGNFKVSWGYGRARGNTENNWTSLMSSADAQVRVRDGTSGNFTNLVMRWYVPYYYIGKSIQYTVHDYVNQSVISDIGARDYDLGTRTFANPVPDATIGTIATLASRTAYMVVPYSYSTKVGPSDYYKMRHYVQGTSVDDNTITSPSGSIQVPMSSSVQNVDFQTYLVFTLGAQRDPGYFLLRKFQPIIIPAYQWPASLTPTYNASTGTMSVSWSVPSLSGVDPASIIRGDNFELQRSTDNTFPSDKTTTYTIPYGTDITSYSKADDLSELNIQGTVYYRLRRTKTSNDWEWREVRSSSFALQTTLLSVNSPDSVKLDETGLSPKAVLKWKVTNGVWPRGSKFIIRRFSKTTGGSSSIDIALTDTELKSGQYADENISFCTRYSYSLLVQPGNSNYAAPAEVRVPGEAVAIEIGTISNLTASKGYYPDRVGLQWRSEGGFSNYVISRSATGTIANSFQIATVPSASVAGADLLFEDSRGTPGVYYTYFVQGISDCGGVVRKTAALTSVGFRSPTGTVYGRITYQSGQAVENVAVRLQSNDQAQLGQSILLNGNANSYLKLDSLKKPFEDSAFTVEAWIRPTDVAPTNQVLFSRGGQYDLGFDNAGKLYFTFNSTRTITGSYSNTNQTFVHIAAVHRKDSMFLLLNDEVIGKTAVSYAASTPQKQVYIGRNAAGNYFKGYIDEIRVWNIALSPSMIARDYTRLLAGNEDGLAAYWRLDETIADQFYDASHQGDEYNQNDGFMSPQQVSRSKTIPAAEQLGLKAYTDGTGNYMVTGIPFTGNGTTYTIAPLLGTHQFDPTSVNRLISSASSQFAVDFKDNSSFPVTGIVYYNNSTVPVSGVQFKIDGKLAQQTNGAIIETDEAGKFTISVPVGVHEVQAVKANHVFVNGGKITNMFGDNLNYQNTMAGVELYDGTTVRFIGRVAGGSTQEALPLGHSVSVNNLGKQLSLTLKLPSGNKYALNKGTADSVLTHQHLLPSNQPDLNKIRKTRVVYKTNQVIIYPDSITGEFIADLIPEKFLASNVSVTGWGDILDGATTSLDLTSKFSMERSVRTYSDSVQSTTGTWVKTAYADTVLYNASYKFIKRKTPSVDISQVDASGNPLTYFGNKTYRTFGFTGVAETVTVVNESITGKGRYLYGLPVFNQNQLYTFRIKAFEAYPFYESVNSSNVPVIKTLGGKDVIDNVPTQDGFVSLYNNLRNGSTAADTLSLNNEGLGFYEFTAGDPDLASRGVKDFGASIRFGPATNVEWEWFGSPKLTAYLMGGKLTGTDFVTAGPDKVMMVLRDPPGSKSYSYAEKGSVITTSSKYTGTVRNQGDLAFTKKMGTELVTFTGSPVAGVINSAVTKSGIGYGIQHEEHYTGSDTKETTTTLTTTFKSSDDPLFVGPQADVYVGYSTNITYGQSNNITIIKRIEIKPATDIIIYEPTATSEYLIVQRNGINIGQVFGTMFAYPQEFLESVLIPNLQNLRDNALLPPTTTAAVAQQRANNTKQIVYVSKLAATDPKFGKSNSDVAAFGDAAKTAAFGNGSSYTIYFPVNTTYRTDTILILNQYIANWKRRMADNEQAKLQASLQQNYSFQSGSSIEFSKETATREEHEDEFSIIVGGSVSNSTDLEINGAGFEFSFTESLSTEQGGTFTNSTTDLVKYGFTLASGGTDDYFSVDVLKAADSAFVFRTKGGASSCPYAGMNVTKYYQPGTVLDQPTLRNEVPVITVDQSVANNVPSTRKAFYTLSLKNESEAKLGQNFVLSYVNNDSIKGANISVDGISIANGRVIPIQFGEVIEKVITIERGPTAMDYNDIMIVWHSECQYDPTNRENIADTVLLSAHFIPSCSDINIKFPKDKWVLNSESPVNQQGKRYLPVTIDQFDVNNKLFNHIELQYKASATSTWITAMKFYADSTKFKAAQGEKLFINNPAAINYNLVMDDAAFNDQRYDVQAVSYCDLGNANYITTESNLTNGIKDTYNPRLFGSPQPADGILTVKDDVRLNFNEMIADGLLTSANFQVTGIRNGALSTHSVSARLDGVSSYLATEFDKSFTGKNITAEMWVLPSSAANQTVFSHGDAAGSLELALTSDNKMQVTVGTKVVKSTNPFIFKPGEWAHVALVYNDNSKTVSAFYNFESLISAAPVSAYAGTGHIEYGRSISKANNYFNGKMHEARIWNDTLNSVKLQLNSLKVLSGAENALLAYYPMNEGKGSVAFDKAHGSNATLNGLWSTPAGKAAALNGSGYVKLNTASSPVTAAMDYTLELWFKGDAAQANTTLASNGKGDGTDPAGALNLFSLGFENSLLIFQNNGFKVQADGAYLDNKWHHVAVAVNRNSGSAQLTIDGKLNQFFDAQNLGGIASANTYLGARSYFSADNAVTPKFDRYFKGNIDEFRIWNSYLNQTFITNYNNVRLQGNELGLMAYYPFETYITFQGVTQMYSSLKDAKVQEVATVVVPDAAMVNAVAGDETAPIKDRGPIENLRFDFVVNNDALIINLQESKQALDKTIVTFKAKNIRDVNGNLLLSPITWTAYIDQNPVKWGDKEINLEKVVGTSLTFSSYLVNSSGNSQHYTVYNLPSWLKASPSSGTVDPAGNAKVTFTVNEALNIGSYEEVIFMRNDNNEIETLKLTLQVKGKKPEWIVKPSDYDYNMVVYGKIRLNSVFSINKEDILGAFINGKCVGVANNSYNASNNLWYTFLTVYSSTPTATSVEFRIWQASTGKIYIATPSQAITFANNAVIGTTTVPVIFDGSNLLYQNIALNQNWNWLSFNLAIPANTPINTTLQNGAWSVDDLIKNESATGGFANYTTTGWIGTLKTLNNVSLYKMKVAAAQSLPVSGMQVDVKTTAIPLKGAQWSYISYLPQFNSSVKEGLAGYKASDEDVIKSQTGFAMYSTQNGWIGNLTFLEPGKGYMLYRKRATDTTFYYPTITGSLVGGRVARAMAPNADQRPVAGNFSNANNMTVIATVATGGEFRNGDSIIVYVNGELRSKAKPIMNPKINKDTWFFNIGGDAEQALVFMLERDGNIIAQASTMLRYSADAIVGTLAKPLELEFVKSANVITVNPNPFHQSTTISVNVKGLAGSNSHEIQLSVFDVTGRQVWSMPLQNISGTRFTTTWDGKNANNTAVSNGVYFIQVMVNGVPHIHKVIKQ
jgi:hypothetical protein